MSKLLVITAPGDAEVAADIIQLIRSSLHGCELRCPTLEGRDGDVEQEVLTCHAALALITGPALAEASVPFLLGGAAALEKPVFAALSPDLTPEALQWPVPQANVVQLGDPAGLARVMGRLAGALGVTLHTPEADGKDATSLPDAPDSHIPRGTPMHSDVAPAPEADTVPPGCEASLMAGRAFADCLFRGEAGLQQAGLLDQPFGRFINALGGNWNSLRRLADADLWMEMTDNVLEALPEAQQHLRQWYEVGFQLGTLVNLSDIPRAVDSDGDGNWRERAELDETWGDAMTALLESAVLVGLNAGQVATVEGILENLRNPTGHRDNEHIAQVERLLHHQASHTDNAHATPDLAT